MVCGELYLGLSPQPVSRQLEACLGALGPSIFLLLKRRGREPCRLRASAASPSEGPPLLPSSRPPTLRHPRPRLGTFWLPQLAAGGGQGCSQTALPLPGWLVAQNSPTPTFNS